MGQLELDGTLDLNQFWPNGSSDGDTAHLAVQRIRYDGKATRAFDGAHVRGRVARNVIDQHRAIFSSRASLLPSSTSWPTW